jgi:transglutaminase-like putative cysteine protease
VDKENDEDPRRFLNPSPFIQSDHPKIRQKAREITSKEDSGFERIQKLITWIYKNIEKRPVFSVPDALATLENRIGDCNEHAVLMAALTRASGIPSKVEAGLVYLKGRFYYHAWNSIYLGEWITVDSLFGQIPADATHIRLVSGNQKQQLDLMGVIGKIRLRIIAYD